MLSSGLQFWAEAAETIRDALPLFALLFKQRIEITAIHKKINADFLVICASLDS